MKTVEQIKSLFVDDVEARKLAIQAFVMDESVSYEDRLEIYKTTPDHLRESQCWVFHHPDFKDGEWYKDWWNRYENVDLLDIPDYKEDWDEEKIKKWYLGCMNKGVWSFQYDW